jgi:hypothetical protein
MRSVAITERDPEARQVIYCLHALLVVFHHAGREANSGFPRSARVVQMIRSDDPRGSTQEQAEAESD